MSETLEANRTTLSQRPRTLLLRLNWLLFALAVMLAIYSMGFIYHAVQLLHAPGEVNYAEGTWLFSALRARHGLSLYFDYRHLPYIPMVYPPLDAWVSGLLGSLLNLKDEQVPVAARAVTLGAAFAVSAAIYVCCRALKVNSLPALVAALLFLTPTATFNTWGFAARGDMLAVAFGAWGMAALLMLRDSWGPLLAGALCALAIFSKQSAVAPALAAIWWLLRERKSVLPVFAGAFASVVAVIILLLGLGDFALLVQGTFDLARHPWGTEFLMARVSDLLVMFAPVLPVGLFGARSLLTSSKGAGGLLIRIYLLTATFVFIITSGKVGSASSYCLEIVAVLSVLAGVGLQTLSEVKNQHVPWEIRTAIAVLVMGLLAIQSVQGLLSAQRTLLDTGPDDRPLRASLQQAGGPVFSDNGYAVLEGPNPPPILDPYYFAVLASTGGWDPQPLEKLVAQSYFGSLALRTPLEELAAAKGFPQGVLQEMMAHYRFSMRQGAYYVYNRQP